MPPAHSVRSVEGDGYGVREAAHIPSDGDVQALIPGIAVENGRQLSREQFSDPPEMVRAAEDFPRRAGPGELCFFEDLDPAPWLAEAEEVVLYHWNRTYPSDRAAGLERAVQSGDQPAAHRPAHGVGGVQGDGGGVHEAVGYVYAKGMMRGLSENTFAPYATTDRAMIVTILHRLEGSPAALPFSASRSVR